MMQGLLRHVILPPTEGMFREHTYKLSLNYLGVQVYNLSPANMPCDLEKVTLLPCSSV